MPITGHFEADFSQFTAEVNEGIATLKRLRDESLKSGAAVDDTFATAPGVFKDTATETRTATKEMGALGNMANEVKGMLLGAFTVQAIVSFTRDVVDMADAIGKVAKQTGMTAEEVQRLQFVAGQTSVDFGALSSAAQTLTADLGGDNAGVVAALGKLNINVDDFKKLSPWDRFLELSRAIREVPDPLLQATRAEEVFHGKWKEIFPSITSDMRAVGAAANVLKDDVVRNVGDMNNSLNVFTTDAKNKWAQFLNILTSVDRYADEIAKRRKINADIAKAADDGLASTLATVPRLQLPVIEGIKAITLSEKDREVQERITGDAAVDSMNRNKAALEPLMAKYAEFAKNEEAYFRSVEQLTNRIGGADAVKAAQTWADALGNIGDRVGTLSAAVRGELLDALNAGMEGLAQQGRLTDGLSSRFASLIVAIQNTNEEMRKAPPAVAAASGVTTEYTQKLYDQAIAEDKVRDALGKKTDELKKATDAYKTASYSMGSAYSTGDLNDLAARMGGQIALDSYGNKYVWVPGVNAPPPGRAAGGPVSAGSAYMVGERGPELFVPGSSGTIVPGGGGPTVQNVFHIVDTEAGIAQRVSDTILRTITSARRV